MSAADAPLILLRMAGKGDREAVEGARLGAALAGPGAVRTAAPSTGFAGPPPPFAALMGEDP